MAGDKDNTHLENHSDQAARWRPVASRETLRIRAQVFARIRAFFQERDVMEVDCPALSRHPVSDPNIESFAVEFCPPQDDSQVLYLTTSPEYYMKRLLASGSGSIYQLSHVFRQGELGPSHEPEFMMLEWYRVGFSLDQLMQEIHALVACATQGQFAKLDCTYVSYQQVFQTYLKIDPLEVDTPSIVKLAREHGLRLQQSETDSDTREACLDFLLSHCIQPQLGQDAPCFLTHYPAEQAALARLSEHDSRVAERFELFINGVELANGFLELSDPEEQRRRFERDLATRQLRLQKTPTIDEAFLEALSAGLPSCSGVALGVDRLIQLMIEQKKLKEVLAFPIFHD